MKLLPWICLVALLTTLPLFAEPSGIYYGGSVGQSFIKTLVSDIEEEDLKLDGNDFAFKLYAGVRMSPVLGIEGGYRQLGSVRSKVSDVTFSSQTSGYDLAAVGNLYLGIVDIFIKGGAFWWEEQAESWGNKSVNDGTNFIWGFGATLRLGQMGVKAEWERFELPDYDQLAMLSVGIVFGL